MPRGKYQRKKNQELVDEAPAQPTRPTQVLTAEKQRYEDGVRDVPHEIISAIYDWKQSTDRSNELHSKFSRAVEDQKWNNLMELIKMFGNS